MLANAVTLRREKTIDFNREAAILILLFKTSDGIAIVLISIHSLDRKRICYFSGIYHKLRPQILSLPTMTRLHCPTPPVKG